MSGPCSESLACSWRSYSLSMNFRSRSGKVSKLDSVYGQEYRHHSDYDD